MRLAHYEPLSLGDFPGKLATTVFTVGCNFACPYCHNPELVTAREDTPQLTEEAFFAFLKRRRGKLNGVCITGGEPTLYADLVGFVERIRALGYAIKLDTNGSNPEMLGHLLETNSLDYIAMDVKAPPSRYSEITGSPYALALAETSIRLLAECNTVHEYRTTVLPLLFSEVDIDNITCMLPSGSRYVIQNFVATKTLDPNLVHARGFASGDLEAIADHMRLHYPLLHISTRGGI
jgi:pyruvate formate lyase activating enzyme